MAREHMRELADAARSRQPPCALDSIGAPTVHHEFVVLLEGFVRAMERLDDDVAAQPSAQTRLAWAELSELAEAAGDLHSRVIQWMLPLLVGGE
jgi:hypothetical protein